MSSKSPGRKRKSIIYKVLMLDDQEVPFQLEVNCFISILTIFNTLFF